MTGLAGWTGSMSGILSILPIPSSCLFVPSPLTNRQAQDLFLGRFARVGDLAGDAALVKDEDAVGHAEHFRQFGADHQDRFALASQFVHEQVDLVLGADVDAARRL